MGRLIDADALKEYCMRASKSDDDFRRVSLATLASVVDAQPTAYDVDKVVEQLKLTSKTALDLAIKRIPGFRFMAPAFQPLIDECFEEAVRIVKAGGNS